MIGLDLTLDDSDAQWALDLAAERQSASVGKGERDTRGCGEVPGSFDSFALHDTACQAFSHATNSSWLSHDKASEIDFESTVGRAIVVACEGCSVNIEIPLGRLRSSDVVFVVIRQADERVFRIHGSLLSSEAIRLGRPSSQKVFDPVSGRFVDAIKVSRHAFVYNDAWSESVLAHNSVVIPELMMDARSESKNPRVIDHEKLWANDIVLNHQSLLKSMKSAGKKRLGLCFKFGIDSDDTGGLEAHFLGAFGEKGLINLGFRFRSPPNTYKKMDFDNNVWLCTRGRSDWDLIVQPEDLKKPGFSARRHVLAVQKHVKVMRYVGYMLGAEILDLIASGVVKLKDPTGKTRKKAYFVEQKHFKRTMRELIELVRSEETKIKVAL